MTNLRGYEALQEVAVQLIASTTQGNLLKFIVHKAVELLECDAGTLYLKRDANTAEFAVTVNHSVAYDFERDIVPISGSGIAAYVFQAGTEIRITDAYQIPAKLSYRFDSRITMAVSVSNLFNRQYFDFFKQPGTTAIADVVMKF